MNFELQNCRTVLQTTLTFCCKNVEQKGRLLHDAHLTTDRTLTIEISRGTTEQQELAMRTSQKLATDWLLKLLCHNISQMSMFACNYHTWCFGVSSKCQIKMSQKFERQKEIVLLERA